MSITLVFVKTVFTKMQNVPNDAFSLIRSAQQECTKLKFFENINQLLV